MKFCQITEIFYFSVKIHWFSVENLFNLKIKTAKGRGWGGGIRDRLRVKNIHNLNPGGQISIGPKTKQ